MNRNFIKRAHDKISNVIKFDMSILVLRLKSASLDNGDKCLHNKILLVIIIY